MATMPILLQNHQDFTAMYSQSCAQRTLSQVAAGSVVEQQSLLPNDASNLTTLRSQYWTSTSLEWLGIYQTRSVQYIRHDKSRRRRSKYTMEDAISAWVALGSKVSLWDFWSISNHISCCLEFF
jgi:hypothetical protein